PTFSVLDDDTSNGSVPPLMERSLDDESSSGSTHPSMPSLNQRHTWDDQSSSGLTQETEEVLDIDDYNSNVNTFEFEYGEDAWSELFTPRDLNIHAATIKAGGPDVYANFVGRPARSIIPSKLDLEALRPNFAWILKERIASTLKNTTQFYRAEERYLMRRHFRTRFPGANVNCLAETVAMDTMFSEVPALNN